MATSEATWTAIDGSRVRYVKAGGAAGPDVLVPMRAGLASEEAVWSAIVTVGRAVAADLPADWGELRPPDAVASFVVKAIDVFRLRHPHLAASDGLSAAALSAALNHSGALESLILGADEALDPVAWAEFAALLPQMMLPTLIVGARQHGASIELGVKLPRCRVEVLDDEAPWPRCASAVCAWIAGGYRSVPLAPARP